MRHSKKKKTLLALGTSLLPAAMTTLVKGSIIEGGILMVVSVGMIVGYDYLDDRAKEVKVPEGIDAETFEQAADVLASEGKEAVEKLK